MLIKKINRRHNKAFYQMRKGVFSIRGVMAAQRKCHYYLEQHLTRYLNRKDTAKADGFGGA